ncbi:MAG TPA: EAL domain-containing protein [Acidimicrobiia bacterium]|nr:EAL domain-containing protein [Acidimicrobiia bacterium]
MGGRPWARFLLAGLMLGAAGAVIGGSVLSLVVQVTGWTAVVVPMVRMRSWERRQRLPWACCAAGGALFLLGSIARFVHGGLVGVEKPFPSLADVLFVSGYLALILGQLFLIRFRTLQAERDHMIDAAIVAAGVSLLAWSSVLAPYIRDASIPGPARYLNVGYSTLTLVLLTLTARLAVGPGIRNQSYYLLAGAISLIFVTDLLATLETAGADTGRLILALPVFSYVLFASAAIHPSMARLTEAPPDQEVQLTWKRQLLLAAALLMAPAVLVWQIARDRPIDLPVVVTGSVVLSLLVLARLSGLVRAKERTAERERVLREIGATLVVATSREEILDGTLEAVLALADAGPDARATVMLGDETDLEVVASAGGRYSDPTGRRLVVAGLPKQFTEALKTRRATRLIGTPATTADGEAEGEPSSMLVVPLVSKNELRGAITVTTEALVDLETRRAIEALASEVALALESAALTEDLLRRRSEARFRTLIENSSDLVVVLDRDELVSFVSPASQRLLGQRDSHFVGKEPIQFVHPDDRTAVVEALTSTEPNHGHGEPLEVRLAHADGSYRWFEMLSTDLRHDPEIEGLVVNARDITDRKGAEQLLAKNEARFRALVQNSSDVVAVVDDNAFFTYVSPSILGMLGYKPDELVGTSALNLLPADDVSPALRALARILEQSVAQTRVETRVLDRDEIWHTVDITITDLRQEPAVEGIVLNARDVTVRKALESDLRMQAMHDALTGLGNRAMFTDRVTHALGRSDDYQHVVAVLFVDLDDFKMVNDSLGHEVGDALLVLVAERLGTCLRDVDTAARLGGDEFAVLLESAFNEGEVCGVAERILGSMRAPFSIDGRELAITASVGIAISPDRASSAEVLLRNADMAMYLAKDRGKDRSEVFEESMHAGVFERLELRTDLAHGIDNGELLLHYQPIVSLESQRVVGVEALVRWDHNDRGVLSPDTFVPLAEETGLIVPLGQWVLTEACEQLGSWRRGNPRCPIRSISVNLSVRQLQNDGIVDDVAETLARTGLDPSDLVLEITESMLMTDTDATRTNLSGLRALGVSLAVDDFGTGYSSLGSIQYLPVDTIKIDKTFVSGLGQEGGDESVVRAILGLAQGLGVRTVAEGIEGAEQLEALRELDCNYGQGYYFSKPLTADAVHDLLRAGVEGEVVGWEPAA